jgi:hypothetical protein
MDFLVKLKGSTMANSFSLLCFFRGGRDAGIVFVFPMILWTPKKKGRMLALMVARKREGGTRTPCYTPPCQV